MRYSKDYTLVFGYDVRIVYRPSHAFEQPAAKFFPHNRVFLYLNKYGHAALNGWDGNSVSIDNEGGVILTPQVGAGKKECVENAAFRLTTPGLGKEVGASLGVNKSFLRKVYTFAGESKGFYNMSVY